MRLLWYATPFLKSCFDAQRWIQDFSYIFNQGSKINYLFLSLSTGVNRHKVIVNRHKSQGQMSLEMRTIKIVVVKLDVSLFSWWYLQRAPVRLQLQTSFHDLTAHHIFFSCKLGFPCLNAVDESLDKSRMETEQRWCQLKLLRIME